MNTELDSPFTGLKIKRSFRSAERKEILLIKYENILRGVDYHLMEILQKPSIQRNYGGYFDYHKVRLDAKWLMGKTNINILKDICYPEFRDRMDTIREELIDRYIDFYERSPELPFVEDLRMLLRNRRLVDHVYIYHPFEDMRIRVDCENLFEEHQMRFSYIFGNLEDFLVRHTDITAFVTDDISDVGRCISIGNVRFMEFLIGCFQHNYFEDGEPLIDFEEIMRTHVCKIGTLIPYKIEEDEEEDGAGKESL